MKRGPYKQKDEQRIKYIVMCVSEREKEAIKHCFSNTKDLRNYVVKKTRGRPLAKRQLRNKHVAIRVSEREKDAIMQHFRTGMDLRDYLVKVASRKAKKDENKQGK
jgi:UTP-glucose-1-phosphate uridylyltransferase